MGEISPSQGVEITKPCKPGTEKLSAFQQLLEEVAFVDLSQVEQRLSCDEGTSVRFRGRKQHATEVLLVPVYSPASSSAFVLSSPV